MARLTARVRKLQQADQAWFEAEYRRAASELMARMAAERVQTVIDWEARPDVRDDFLRYPRDPWLRREARLRPPRLVSVMHWFMRFHLDEGRPLELPPEVAQIYIADADAYPCAECRVCGYLSPVRIAIRRGRAEAAKWYFSECPLCTLDG